MNRSRAITGACLAAIAAAAAGCSTSTHAPAPVAVRPPAERGAVIRNIEPWTFGQADGVIITTAHYRIFTTAADSRVIQRLPAFLEQALAHYRTLGGVAPPFQAMGMRTGSARELDARTSAIGQKPDAARLPAPQIAMDTFIVASRPQWEDLTIRLMGDRAPTYLRIDRGGFAAGGRGVFYTGGGGAGDDRTTLAIAAHEGWHQYTQRVMQDPLPVWLDEAMAVYCEGFREDPSHAGGVEFRPWANPERFDQLRSCWARGGLLSLEELLAASPQSLLQTSAEGTLDYYAQLWALGHFLRENPEMRGGLEALLIDAARGQLRPAMRSRYGARAAGLALESRLGPLLFEAYLAPDVAAASAAYRAFVDRIVQTGAKERIILGLPPV